MKRNKGILSLVLAAVSLVLLLGSCGNSAAANQKKSVGIWQGMGDLGFEQMEMEMESEMPFDYVETLFFAEDGSGYMAGQGQKMDFTYVMTDDTLTLRLPEVGWGMVYEIDGDTLTVRDSEFTRKS